MKSCYVLVRKGEEVSKELLIVSPEGKENVYSLVEVTRKELAKHRLSEKSGIVLKENNKFYYTPIPANIRIYVQESSHGKHLCGLSCAGACSGCARTQDLTVDYQMRFFHKEFFNAVKDSWRIEKYPFITNGIESFNMDGNTEAMIVLECKNYFRKNCFSILD